MSVQALSGDFLDEANLTRLYELQFNTPGLVVNNVGLFGARFALRGISDQGGSEHSVATHLNGVYLGTPTWPSPGFSTSNASKYSRVRKEPSMAGTRPVVRSTSSRRSPQDSFSADIEGCVRKLCNEARAGSVNLPMPGAAVRLAFIASEGDGYIRNSVDDRQICRERFLGTEGSLKARRER